MKKSILSLFVVFAFAQPAFADFYGRPLLNKALTALGCERHLVARNNDPLVLPSDVEADTKIKGIVEKNQEFRQAREDYLRRRSNATRKGSRSVSLSKVKELIEFERFIKIISEGGDPDIVLDIIRPRLQDTRDAHSSLLSSSAKLEELRKERDSVPAGEVYSKEDEYHAATVAYRDAAAAFGQNYQWYIDIMGVLDSIVAGKGLDPELTKFFGKLDPDFYKNEPPKADDGFGDFPFMGSTFGSNFGNSISSVSVTGANGRSATIIKHPGQLPPVEGGNGNTNPGTVPIPGDPGLPDDGSLFPEQGGGGLFDSFGNNSLPQQTTRPMYVLYNLTQPKAIDSAKLAKKYLEDDLLPEVDDVKQSFQNHPMALLAYLEHTAKESERDQTFLISSLNTMSEFYVKNADRLDGVAKAIRQTTKWRVTPAEIKHSLVWATGIQYDKYMLSRYLGAIQRVVNLGRGINTEDSAKAGVIKVPKLPDDFTGLPRSQGNLFDGLENPSAQPPVATNNDGDPQDPEFEEQIIFTVGVGNVARIISKEKLDEQLATLEEAIGRGDGDDFLETFARVPFFSQIYDQLYARALERSLLNQGPAAKLLAERMALAIEKRKIYGEMSYLDEPSYSSYARLAAFQVSWAAFGMYNYQTGTVGWLKDQVADLFSQLGAAFTTAGTEASAAIDGTLSTISATMMMLF